MAKEAGSPEQAVSDIEAALRSMETLAAKPSPSLRTTAARPGARAQTQSRSGRSILGSAFRWLLAIAGLCVLPLIVLVGMAVWFYLDFGLWPWLSVIAGALAAALALIVFVLILIKAGTGSFRAPRYMKRFLVGLTVVYIGYSTLYVAATNVKTDDVRATYRALHPSLRVALSTWMLADPSLVITDAERTVEDYGRMGLPANEKSLHFETESGYVHAVDLRTIGRPEWRNFLTTLYFKGMGFNALRHEGTADHLHVSLPLSN